MNRHLSNSTRAKRQKSKYSAATLDLLIHFQITKVFEQGDTGQHVVLKRLEELFIQYDLNPTNADGSIPVLVTRKLPLTEGDEINLDTIVNQFNQFQEAVVEVLY